MSLKYNIRFSFLITKVTKCGNSPVDTFHKTKIKCHRNFTIFLTFETSDTKAVKTMSIGIQYMCRNVQIASYLKELDKNGKIESKLKQKLDFSDFNVTFGEFAKLYSLCQVNDIFSFWDVISNGSIRSFLEIFEFERAVYLLQHEKDKSIKTKSVE